VPRSAGALGDAGGLEDLILRQNPIGDAGGAALLAAAPASQSLQTLNLSACRLGAATGEALVSLLASKPPPLRHLDLSANDVLVRERACHAQATRTHAASDVPPRRESRAPPR
jgi:hypothetical protein